MLVAAFFCTCFGLAAATAAPIGGFYSVSNNAINTVIVYNIMPGGGLTLRKQVPTGGIGYNGITGNTPKGNSLGSQGAVAVLRNNLFVVNAGSNDVTYFTLDAADPAKLNFVAVVSSGGDFPASVTAFGNTACVMNSGVNNGIRCFTFSEQGGLVPIPSWDRSTGLSGSILGQISFSPDGSLLVLAVRGGASAGILVYTVSGGTLSATAQSFKPLNAVAPFGFAFGPVKDASGNFVVFVTDPGNNGSYDVFSVNPSTGASPSAALLGNFALPAGSVAPCWAIYSNASGTFFAINAGSSSLSQVRVTTSDLSSTVLGNVAVSVAAPLLDAAVLPYSAAKDFAYVIAPRANVVAQLAITGTSVSVAATFGLPDDATVSVMGAAVYSLLSSGNSCNSCWGTSSGPCKNPSNSVCYGFNSGTTTCPAGTRAC